MNTHIDLLSRSLDYETACTPASDTQPCQLGDPETLGKSAEHCGEFQGRGESTRHEEDDGAEDDGDDDGNVAGDRDMDGDTEIDSESIEYHTEKLDEEGDAK